MAYQYCLGKLSLSVAVLAAAPSAHLLELDLCPGASVVSVASDWVWSRDVPYDPSCTNPPLENPLQMCSDDPTSIVIQGSGQAQCLAARMDQCKFDMHNVTQIDFDVRLSNCAGTWAAPLWITPDYWTGLGESGEVDMMELCPASAESVFTNFGGATPTNSQKKWTSADPNNFSGHVTMRKGPIADDQGVIGVTVQVCAESAVQGGACPLDAPAYVQNIYGTNACTDGHDCKYTFVSDIFNGNAGDSGYSYCSSGRTHASSGCSFSVRNISVQALPYSFSDNCAALLSGGTPTVATTTTTTTLNAVQCSAHPQCTGLQGDCCPTDDGVMLGCCGSQGSAACSANKGCAALQPPLQGNCCPTDAGLKLDCCNEVEFV